jgi:hypothetical protein
MKVMSRPESLTENTERFNLTKISVGIVDVEKISSSSYHTIRNGQGVMGYRIYSFGAWMRIPPL